MTPVTTARLTFRKNLLPAASGPLATWNRQDWFWLGGILMLALILRGIYWLQVHNEIWFTHPVIDSAQYHHWAKAILQGDWLGQGPYEHSPLYAFFLAFCYKLLGVKVAFVAGVQLILGACCCSLIYILARRFFSAPIAALAGAAQAVYGLAFFHEGTLLTTVLIEFLNLWLLLATYWAQQKSDWKRWALPGFILGLSFLTRPNVSLYLGVLLCWIGLMNFSRGWAWLLKAGMILCTVFILTILPSAVRNVVVLHEWMWSVPYGGLCFWGGNGQTATGYSDNMKDYVDINTEEIPATYKAKAEKVLGRKLTYSEANSFWQRKGWDEIAAKPEHWQYLLQIKSLLFFNTYEVFTSLNYYAVRQMTSFLRLPWLAFSWVMPLALLGMLGLLARWKELFSLYGYFVVYLFGNIILLVSSEYRYAIMPVFFIFFAYGFYGLVLLVKHKFWFRLILCLVMLSGLFFLANFEILNQDERNSQLAWSHWTFGRMWTSLGNSQAAILEYKAAQALVPTHPEYLATLAFVVGEEYKKLKAWPEAYQALATASTLAPEASFILDSLATVATAQQNYPEAIRLRTRVVELSPQEAEVYLNLGITYLYAHEDKLAQAAFNQALALKPDLATEIQARKTNSLQSRH